MMITLKIAIIVIVVHLYDYNEPSGITITNISDVYSLSSQKSLTIRNDSYRSNYSTLTIRFVPQEFRYKEERGDWDATIECTPGSYISLEDRVVKDCTYCGGQSSGLLCVSYTCKATSYNSSNKNFMCTRESLTTYRLDRYCNSSLSSTKVYPVDFTSSSLYNKCGDVYYNTPTGVYSLSVKSSQCS